MCPNNLEKHGDYVLIAQSMDSVNEKHAISLKGCVRFHLSSIA